MHVRSWARVMVAAVRIAVSLSAGTRLAVTTKFRGRNSKSCSKSLLLEKVGAIIEHALNPEMADAIARKLECCVQGLIGRRIAGVG